MIAFLFVTECLIIAMLLSCTCYPHYKNNTLFLMRESAAHYLIDPQLCFKEETTLHTLKL